jgi:hypothetical protein
MLNLSQSSQCLGRHSRWAPSEYKFTALKGNVYKNNPRSVEALQNEITRVIGSIAVDELQKVSHNLFMRCEACLQAEGGQFQHLL